MIAAILLVLAQGLVLDGTRYEVAADGRLHATRVADNSLRYRWWPDPPALPLTGRLGAGQVELQSRRRTVLAAGIGTGPGLYALDITDPLAAEATPLRVFRTDDVAGLVTEALVVARLGPHARPFVIGSSGQGARKPGLLLVALDGAAHAIIEIHSPGATLGGVAVARHADGRVLYAYAGDSAGKVWRFDLSGELPWSQPKLRRPIFSAARPDGTPQSIQRAPAVMFGPGKGYLIAFGSSDARDNTLYAVHDPLGKPAGATRADLVRRKARREGDGLRIDGSPVDYDKRAGWYLDLACGEGERMADLQAGQGLLLASTSVAAEDGPGDGCSYALAPLSGLPPEQSLTGRRTSAAGDTVAELFAIGPADQVARSLASSIRVQALRLGRRDGDGRLHWLQDLSIQRRYGRLGWRELPHWRALHRATPKEPP